MKKLIEALQVLFGRKKRRTIRLTVFPEEPLAEPEDHAVEKYFGIFDKYIKKDHPKDIFEKIINES